MHILVVTEYYYPRIMGGGEISAQLLLEESVKQGIKVTLLTGKVEGAPEEEIRNGVRILRRIKTGKNPASLLGNLKRLTIASSVKNEVERIVAEKHDEELDLIHVMGVPPLQGVLRAKTDLPKTLHLRTSIPFCPKSTLVHASREGETVCSLARCTRKDFYPCLAHSTEIGKQQITPIVRYNPLAYEAMYWRFEQSSPEELRKCDRIVCISSFLAQRCAKIGVPKEKLSVIHNPVIIDEYMDLKSEQHDPPRIYFAGNIVRSKGVMILLEALSGCSLPYRVRFYGTGPLEEECKVYAKKNNIPLQIFSWKSAKEMMQVHQENDICVLPSIVAEGLGRVLIEAMAAEKVVIGSTAGGISDIFSNGESGLSFEAANSKDLRRVLEKVLKDKILRRRMAKNARHYASEAFRVTDKVEELQAIWEKVVEEKA